MGLESIKTSISSVTGAIAPVGSRGRYGDIDPTNNATDALVDRGDPDADPGFSLLPNPIDDYLKKIQNPLLGLGIPSRNNPLHIPVSTRTPPTNGGINPQAPKAESQGPTKTTSPQPSPRQAAINSLAKTMADDARQSPQKAIDKGAVDQAGKVTPNKLEPAVKKELTKLVEDFRKNSADFSKTIKDLGEKIQKDNEADDKFKKAYNDFKDKYDKNFVEGKDLLNEGFNAKEVIDSFQKAYDLSKGTRHQEGMDQIQQDIIDKYIKPMDSLARGDQGPALVARDKMKESLTGPDRAIDKLKQAGKNDEKLNTALENLSQKLKEPGYGKTDLKEQRKDVETEIARLKNDTSLSANERENLDKLSKQVDKASELYERMDKVAYAGVTEKDGKAVLDESKLGFKPEEVSKDYFQYMHENHREDIISNLEDMKKQRDDIFNDVNVEDIKKLTEPDSQTKTETERINQDTKLLDFNNTFPDEVDETENVGEDLVAQAEPEIPEPEIEEDENVEIA